MVHVSFINDQKTVVTVPIRPDSDRRVLAVIPVEINLKLLCDALRVDGGRYSRLPFAQHEQHALINVVVNEHKGMSGRLDKIRSEFIGIEDLAVEEDTLYWWQRSTDKKIYFVRKFFQLPVMDS